MAAALRLTRRDGRGDGLSDRPRSPAASSLRAAGAGIVAATLTPSRRLRVPVTRGRARPIRAAATSVQLRPPRGCRCSRGRAARPPGETIREGLHHGAQKSISTGTEAVISSKLAGVASTIQEGAWWHTLQRGTPVACGRTRLRVPQLGQVAMVAGAPMIGPCKLGRMACAAVKPWAFDAVTARPTF